MYYLINGVPQIFGVPIGSISAYLGTSSPTGFVLCDGVQRENTDDKYTALYQLGVGTMTTNETHYTPPDYRGMFIGGSSNTSSVGGTGGDNNITLSTSNLPAHSHNGFTDADPGHVHGMNTGNKDDKNFTSGSTQIPPGDGPGTSNNGATIYNTKSAGYHVHSFTTSIAGSGTAFSIVPEHVKVNYIVKY